jgi:hypothetical protein
VMGRQGTEKWPLGMHRDCSQAAELDREEKPRRNRGLKRRSPFPF